MCGEHLVGGGHQCVVVAARVGAHRRMNEVVQSGTTRPYAAERGPGDPVARSSASTVSVGARCKMHWKSELLSKAQYSYGTAYVFDARGT
ncbi:MAG: hypothetical protein JWQ86_2467 [Mycobacterium sp.]|jgi:hypothetical protein|nr:hypothetical protein [Mycobacterium sp.]MDT5212954.1 hypothetical protein [Mycobacterium sp.]